MLAVLVALVLIVIGMYNSLVRLRAACESAWADIDVQLKRRYDLIPNLVETVKAYAAHEKGALEAVINARAKAMSAQGPEAKAAAEHQLSQSLKSLFALAEAYPQLRAVEAFNQLQSSLNQIEEALQQARRYYNAVVRDYNAKTQEIPTNVIAGWFHFVGRQFFELTDNTQREPPRVQF
ncbi:MAG: LemA family protein [Nitrospira sp. CR1.1]|nr:LemA family protein [Nitrospira sp. CR1.1]